MKLMNKLFIILACTTLLASCYPDKIETIDDLDVTATAYDNEVDFTELKTFSLIDSIITVSNPDYREDGLDIKNEEMVLELIKSNLLDLGYIEVDNDEAPDVIVTATALATDHYYAYSWYDYWGWYPGFSYWWGPGYWYPVYPYPTTIFYGYTSGTLIVDMLNSTSVAEEKIPVVWTGIADGILVNDDDYNADRLEKTINQMFTQSPYLSEGK